MIFLTAKKGRESLPEDLIEKAVNLVRNGKSYASAAKELGLKPSSVRHHCLKRGVKSRFKPFVRKGLPKQKIAEEYQGGKSIPILAREYDCTEAAIYHIVEKTCGTRSVTESMALGYGDLPPLDERWVKLTKYHGALTRQISISVSLLRKLGFDGDEKILGRWIIEKGRLVLQLREDSGSSTTHQLASYKKSKKKSLGAG